MKKHALHFLTLFCLLVTVSVGILIFFPTKEDMELYSGFIRLHVVANSDSDEDQALKLKVRDAVLELLGDEMETSPDLEQARTAAERLMPEAERVARHVLRDSGFSYGATVTLGYEYYPTRDYGGFRLPAGRYLSYRIVLGSGEGHNWWCVVFPSVCIPSAAKGKLSDSASESASKMAENPQKYVMKFKAVEWYEAIRKKNS